MGDIATLASWGATLVRFQMIRNWSAEDDNRDIAEFTAWLDSRLDNLEDVLRWAGARGLAVVVDLHVPPGGKRPGDRQMNMFEEDRFADAFVGKALPGFGWLPWRHEGRPPGPRRRAARQHPVRLQRPRVRPRPRPGLREGVLRAYFDAVFAARRVRCPVEIRRAGLGDYVSPPSSLAVLYNALDVPKTITWNQGWTHGWSPVGMDKWTVHGGSDTIRAHD